MAVYKVSYVVTGSDHPGGIVNLEKLPKVGESIQVGNADLKVIEIFELIPPRRDFYYMHATCEFVERE
ncbi:MAG: hypothetical protein ISR58_18105 [Anaerolineales bacterium]|nr:hypothetical protein [Anaerolineales bacterium]